MTDARDWPTNGAFFLPRALNLEDSSPLVRRARCGAECLKKAFGKDVLCIYAFGTAVDDSSGDPPGDIDLLVVVPDEIDSNAAETNAATLLEAMPLEEGCPRYWDVVVRPRRAIEGNAFFALLVTARSALLLGEPIWKSPPKIAANERTARALWIDKRRELGFMIREVHAFLANESLSQYQASVVRRVQKRVLRLGMLDALAAEGVFSTDVERCAELTARAHPELADAVQDISHDLHTRDDSLGSLERAIELCADLLRRSPLAIAKP